MPNVGESFGAEPGLRPGPWLGAVFGLGNRTFAGRDQPRVRRQRQRLHQRLCRAAQHRQHVVQPQRLVGVKPQRQRHRDRYGYLRRHRHAEWNGASGPLPFGANGSCGGWQRTACARTHKRCKFIGQRRQSDSFKRECSACLQRRLYAVQRDTARTNRGSGRRTARPIFLKVPAAPLP